MQLSEIAEIKSFVEKSRLLPAREAFFRQAAIVKMAHTSTSIEGNVLQEYQVADLAKGKDIHADEDQIREVKNYLSGLKEIDKFANSKSEFDEKDILKIHKVVINGFIDKEKTGVWRPGQVYIVNIKPFGHEEIAYIPPAFGKVPGLIKDLISWLKQNKNVHPIIRSALFHYQFETIHPFPDGNGRTGRLMTLLHLYQSGWDFKKILVLEDYYNENRKGYYEALQTGKTFKSRQQADLSGWLEYYIGGFLKEARKVKDLMLNLLVIQDINPSRATLDQDELKIVDFVISLGEIRSSDVVDILQIPKRTAQSKLKKLEEINVLKKVGSGPSTYYVIQGK
ncbi:MAG: Fic family protein [Patescibacteria group bacterium]